MPIENLNFRKLLFFIVYLAKRAALWPLNCYRNGLSAVTRAIIVTTLVLSFGLPAHRVHAVIPEGIATGVLMDKFFGSLDETIRKAREAGDFLLWRAAIQMRDALDGWKRTNSSLIEKAFDELDKSQQEIFRKIDSLYDSAVLDKDITIAQVEDISLQFSQIISKLPLVSDDPWVMDYNPRVIAPVGEDRFLLTVKGPNLARAEATLDIGGGEPLSMDGPREAEIAQSLERNALPFADSTSTFHKISLSFDEHISNWIQSVFLVFK